MSRAAADKRQFMFNMSSNLFVLAVTSVVTLWFTPYLLGRLGLALYGLVPLAMSLSMYMGILTVGVQAAVGRYLSLAVASGDRDGASRVMSTALGANLVIAFGLMPLLLGIAIAAPSLFDIPAGHETDARWFFAFAMLSYVLVALREVIGATAFSANRMDLQNVARLTETFTRIAFVVVAFSIQGPDLKTVGLGMLVGAAVSIFVALASWYAVAREVRVAASLFDRSRLSEMLFTGGWVTFNHVGSLLHMATDVVVINLMLGSAVAGAYGSVLQLSSFLRSLAGSLSSVLAPVLFAQYAQNRKTSLGSTAAQAVKLLALGLGLPAALVLGFARPVLLLWLGPDLAMLAPLLMVMVVHLAYNYAFLPLEVACMAHDRVKWPAIVSVSTGVLNIALSVLLARAGEWAIGVAVATLVSVTLRYGVFTPLYTAHVTGSKSSRFFGAALPGFALSVLAAAGAWGLDRATQLSTWGGLIAGSAVISLVYITAAYIMLKDTERTLVLSLVGVKRS